MRKLIRILTVLLFVVKWHQGQKRKYTGHPYFFHLIAVAWKIYKIRGKEKSIVVALCHDLYEDTNCTPYDLIMFLQEVGYTINQAIKMSDGVCYLTDEFTKEAYPKLNRKERKQLEAYRLSKIPKWCQTIKYADLINNTCSIIKHDKDFAKVYLLEKEEILKGMRRGNLALLVETILTLEKAKKQL